METLLLSSGGNADEKEFSGERPKEPVGKFGFIVLRHVNNELSNNYWIKCVNSIRQYYPDIHILIIDDNSNYNFIASSTPENLYNITIINSEYPGRGELLPYYYYLHNKLFDTAIIIHDSVFINRYIDYKYLDVENYKFLWDFEHEWDEIKNETIMINIFNDLELNALYENKNLWKGCFGCMSIIKHDFLMHVNNKYNISKLLNVVTNRRLRCCFERIIACLFILSSGRCENKTVNAFSREPPEEFVEKLL